MILCNTIRILSCVQDYVVPTLQMPLLGIKVGVEIAENVLLRFPNS